MATSSETTFSIEDAESFLTPNGIVQNLDNIDIVDDTEFNTIETKELTEEIKPEIQPDSDLEIIENTEESEEVVDTKAKSYEISLHRGLAKAFAEKFNFDLDENAVTDLDSLSEVMEQLSNNIIESKWETMKNSTSDTQAVVTLLEQGGDIKKLAHLFKEEETVYNIDISTVEGKVDLINSYYKKELKWSDDRIKKHISKMEDEDINEESDNIQTLYKESFEKKRDNIVKEEQQKLLIKENEKKQKVRGVGQFMTNNKYNDKQIKEYLNFAYQDAYELGNDKLTKLDVALLNIHKTPEKLVSLIEFLTDEESFVNKKVSEKVTKKTESDFKKILENQINKKVGDTNVEQTKKSTIKPIQFNL